MYTSAINRIAGDEPDAMGSDMKAIFDKIMVRPPASQLSGERLGSGENRAFR